MSDTSPEKWKVLRLGHDIFIGSDIVEAPAKLPKVLRLGLDSNVYFLKDDEGVTYEDIQRDPAGTGGVDEGSKRSKFNSASETITLQASSTPFVNIGPSYSISTRAGMRAVLEALSPVHVLKDRLIHCGVTDFGICGETPFFCQPDR